MERDIRIRSAINMMDTLQGLCGGSLHLTHSVGKCELSDIKFMPRGLRYTVRAYLLSGFVQNDRFVIHGLAPVCVWF